MTINNYGTSPAPNFQRRKEIRYRFQRNIDSEYVGGVCCVAIGDCRGNTWDLRREEDMAP